MALNEQLFFIFHWSLVIGHEYRRCLRVIRQRAKWKMTGDETIPLFNTIAPTAQADESLIWAWTEKSLMKARTLQFTVFLSIWLLPLMPYAATAQLGTVELSGSCPTGCKLVQNITNVTTAEDSNGVRVSFNWTLASVPAGVSLLGFNVSAKLVLKNNNTVESGEVNVGANATSATVVVRGRILNRNINLSDVKSGSVLVKANAKSTSNPTVSVTSKEIVGNDGAEVNMLVKWTAPAVAPCLSDRAVVVSASAENAGGIKFDGSASAKLTANSATVRLRGPGLRRKEMKNLKASITASPAFIACGTTKSIQSFGGAQGSNP